MADYKCFEVRRAGEWLDSFELCVLTYDERFLRRKVITTAHDETILIDLEHTTSLDHADALMLEDGRFIEVIAAQEPLLQITGNDLVKLAWHVGNRHTPCQIEKERLLIQADSVIGHMLEHLGAKVTPVSEPFIPEGGAYGHGRTHSHEHVHTAHEH